jgi:hypothetical protein
MGYLFSSSNPFGQAAFPTLFQDEIAKDFTPIFLLQSAAGVILL